MSCQTLLFIVLGLIFIQGVIYILSNDLELINIDDSYNVFNAAENIVKNNYSSIGYKSYINVYPNNIGLMSYFVILIKIFGKANTLLVVRLINLVFSIIGYLYLYKITDKLFLNEKINRILIILILINNQLIYLSELVYGNVLSYSLSIVSVYYLLVYLKKKTTKHIIVSIITIIISIFIKSNSIIVMIAECIYLLLDFISNKKIISIFAVALMLAGQFLATTGLQMYWGSKVEIDYSQSKLPTICWIANGINYDSRNPGRYTNQFEIYHMENDLVPEYTAVEAKRFVNEAIKYFEENPQEGLKFYVKKFLVSFANPTYECIDEKNIVLETIWDASCSVVAIGLVLFMTKDYKNEELYRLIGLVVVIGGFLFHSFWETKAVYCYQYYLFLLPYAAYGLSNIKKK